MHSKLSRLSAIILAISLLLSLSIIPASAASYSTSSPAAAKVVTDRDPLNIRSGAGTNYKVVSQAKKGSYLQVIGSSGSFYKVVYNANGKTGYASKSYLDIVSTGTAKVTTATTPLVLRSKASTSGKNLDQIPKGSVVPTLGKTGNWYKVVYRNQIGYCSASYLTPTNKTQSTKKTTITFSSISNPGTITKGNGVHISGTIKSSNSKLSSITASIRNSSGKSVVSKTVKPNAYSYSIYNSALDWAMTFGSLSTGSYTLRYDVKTADGTSNSISKSFTVKAKSTSASKPTNTSGYDANAALAYAKKNWNKNPEQQCAEFVSQCLKAGGGIKSIEAGVGGLSRAVKATGMGTLYQLKVESNGSINVNKNKGKLSPGDPILTYCTREGAWPHAVLFSGTTSNGTVRVYAHNSAKNNEAYFGFDVCNGGCPAHGSEIIAYSYHYN